MIKWVSAGNFGYLQFVSRMTVSVNPAINPNHTSIASVLVSFFSRFNHSGIFNINTLGINISGASHFFNTHSAPTYLNPFLQSPYHSSVFSMISHELELIRWR